MSTILQSCWFQPKTILFATESPTSEKAFAFALATALEFKSKLIVFHVYDTLAVAASEISGVRYYDYAAAAHSEEAHLRPLIQRATNAGVHAEIVVRPGLAAPQILAYVSEHPIDRIIMGTRSPGPLGKLFIGSVAEEVIRRTHVPVMTIGPEVMDGALHAHKIRRILCAISLNRSCMQVAELATSLALAHKAHLTLLHVMPSREELKLEQGRSIESIEAELRSMVPAEMHKLITVESITAVGTPAEEILYQSNLRQIDLLVFGAQGASQISTIARQGLVNRVLAHALCPVLTFTAEAPAIVSATAEEKAEVEAYMAGIF